MASFTSYSNAQLDHLQETLRASVAHCAVYEQAAQTFTQLVFEEFSPHTVLSRVYFTVPYKSLPKFNKTFIDNLGKAKGVSHLIKDETPILSLVGTSGKKVTWRDRRQSQGHVGIPLCSSEFINEIPMMSRLLQELGLNLAWFDKQDLSLAEKSMTGMSGVFHVTDASQDVDIKGRKIISAQDFVSANGVSTVFGLGTIYIGGVFVVSIFFTDEKIGSRQIKPFLPLMNTFKAMTTKYVTEGKIFTA